MSTTIKAIVYPLLLAIYGVLGHVLGVASSPGQNSVIIATAIVGGVIMVVDIYWSHSRAAQLLNTPVGADLERMIAGKVAIAVDAGLARIPVITGIVTPPVDPTISPPIATTQTQATNSVS